MDGDNDFDPMLYGPIHRSLARSPLPSCTIAKAQTKRFFIRFQSFQEEANIMDCPSRTNVEELKEMSIGSTLDNHFHQQCWISISLSVMIAKFQFDMQSNGTNYSYFLVPATCIVAEVV
ncbi:hypothetical protein E5D57_000231 [Metarhizium anisopliae]|nr:hypothetical protein E5D57_008223 [Metarhizium anisopliae]KAF5136469.1 hypothetical protein E5D57_000231 [Metarhizium anisopliae]